MKNIIKKKFLYVLSLSFLFHGCTFPVKVSGYDSQTINQQYIIATLEEDIECTDVQTVGSALNIKLNLEKGTKLIGEKIPWNNRNLISLEGITSAPGFADFRYNLLITQKGELIDRIHIKKKPRDTYPLAKCKYYGNSPITLKYQNQNKGKHFRKPREKKESGNFLAKLAGSALMVAVGSGAMGGQANALSTELTGAALQDIWNDDENKKSEFQKVLQKQNNASTSTDNKDIYQEIIDDSNKMVEGINQNLKNEKLKKAEMEKEAIRKHQSTSTAYKRQVQRANRRIARAEKKLADAKAHDKAMITSADNARKAEEARKQARARRGEIVYGGVNNSSNPIKSSKEEQKKIAIAYCWGWTGDYRKKKSFTCSGRIQLVMSGETAKDESDEDRALAHQLELVGCDGKVGVNRSYDLGQATLFPVQSERNFPDYIGEGVADGAWFKCYDHKLKSGDNSPGRVSRFIRKKRAK